MNVSDLLLVPSIATSPIQALMKVPNVSLLQVRDMLLKSYNEGIYHITSEEAANSIMATRQMRASNQFISYGKKKCFFYAGIPDFESLCSNGGAGVVITAIKLQLTYEQLANFGCRHYSDDVITYEGNLQLDDKAASKVHLGIESKKGKLTYKEISEEQVKNYKPNVTSDELKLAKGGMVSSIRTNIIGFKNDYALLLDKIGKGLHTKKEIDNSYASTTPGNGDGPRL